MKKFVILLAFFSLFTIFINGVTPYLTVSVNPTPCFAKIKYNNVFLYESPSLNSTDTVYCLLQEHYFVKILKEENDLFYLVTYSDLVGYVQKEQVECVAETPSVPYPNHILFYTTGQNNVLLRNQPSTQTEESILCVLSPNSCLTYYGKIAGEEAVSGLGNIWYYSSYRDAQNKIYFGYVYSPFTHSLSAISENSEDTTLIPYEQVANINEFLTIQPNLNFIIILITVFPIPLLLFLFLKKKPSSQI